MSFKKFSDAHNEPAKPKPASVVESKPLVDQPPAPPSKASEGQSSEGKS